MEILQMLSRETEQAQKAYVYEEKGHWYAYENSANLLHSMLKDAVQINQFVNNTYEICLERTEIDFSYLVYCPIMQCSDSELIIDCSPYSFNNNS